MNLSQENGSSLGLDHNWQFIEWKKFGCFHTIFTLDCPSGKLIALCPILYSLEFGSICHLVQDIACSLGEMSYFPGVTFQDLLRICVLS